MHQTAKSLSKSCLLLLTKAHDKQNYLLIVSQFRLHPQIPLLPCLLAMSWRRHSQGGKRVVFSAWLAPDDSYAMHSCCDLRVCQISRYLRSSIEGGVGGRKKHACAGWTFYRIKLIWCCYWDKQLMVGGEHDQAHYRGRKVWKYGEGKGIPWSFSWQPLSDLIPKS